MRLSTAIVDNKRQDVTARDYGMLQRHCGVTTGQEATAGGKAGTCLMMRPAVAATGRAGDVCDGASGIDNDCKLLGRCAKVQSGIEVSAGDAGYGCFSVI